MQQPMFKIPCGQDPYDSVGKYIRDHITAIEDIIAVIEINGTATNQLYMVDMQEDGYFVWKSDWWEGEEDIVLLDFFPVSEATKIIRCKDCIHRPIANDTYNFDDWNCGFDIEFPDYRCPCRCDDEYYNRIPDDDWFCGNADRKER